jgi:cytochrome c peroxidase
MPSSSRTIVSVAALLLLTSVFLVAGTIDLANLLDYENQTVPAYINRDNTAGNSIDNETTTLGRVLFYDKQLSSNDSVSCASCHQQAFAFSDTDVVSQGVNGVTGRHSMRLINSRFSDEVRFFWDERAATLEEQTTQPIQDHGEMGFSGTNGDPDFDDLIVKMQATPYYKTLFFKAFGDDAISEARMQLALAQFIRSIQSFDSKFDVGISQVNGNVNANFPNFSAQENLGKRLFNQAPQFGANGVRVGGGLGCAACHEGAEFSIDPLQQNNGVITVANSPGAVDLTNTRSPTLRDLFSPAGTLNGPMMHDGSMATFDAVMDHYNDITFDPAVNPTLAIRLRGGPQGQGQKLMMTQNERDALTAFVQTLSGTDVYTNELWSDPFEADGTLIVIGVVGDVDQNGSVNFSDISPFIDLLIGGEYQEEADLNLDGLVTFTDIPLFVDLLISQ